VRPAVSRWSDSVSACSALSSTPSRSPSTLPPLLAALIAVAATVAVTGALHEDGLADTVDGFGGGGDRERKLQIMRDSRIGTYGVVALVLALGARVVALASFEDDADAIAALVLCQAASRALIVAVMRRAPLARSDGLAASAGRPTQATMHVGARPRRRDRRRARRPRWRGCGSRRRPPVAWAVAWLAQRQIAASPAMCWARSNRAARSPCCSRSSRSTDAA
jgi:hypothetical protein